MSLRPTWFVYEVPGQPELHSATLSLKKEWRGNFGILDLKEAIKSCTL